MAKKVTLKSIDVNNLQIKGWQRKFLKLQRQGLTGHIEVAGYPFNQIGWDKYEIDTTKLNDNPGWWAYEQVAYALDGQERCGELLKDNFLLDKVTKAINFVLSEADSDGYLGPKFLKETDGWNRWPHVVFFRALLARYYYTKDQKILDALTKHYLNYQVDYSNDRDILNVEIMLLVYLENHNDKLLDFAIKNYQKYNDNCQNDLCEKVLCSTKKPYAHGVSYNEFAKLGALFYICTNDKKYLKTSIMAYKKIDKYFMLVDGLHCSNEFLIDSNYMESHETCDISDYTWALFYLLMATKNGKFADKIEKCIYNAGIGSVSENFKALQYFSCPNQVILDRNSNHNLFFKGDKWMSYRPNPGTECCAGNVNRFMPNFTMKMYLKNGNDIYATFYGECVYKDIINNQKIKIIENTNYPFDDTIKFTIKITKPTKFNFYFRIPSWAKQVKISYNGVIENFKVIKGFAKITKRFHNDDEIILILPSEIELKNYKKIGQYIVKGPLLYCYGLKGHRVVDILETKQNNKFKAYNIYPNKDFNYILLNNNNFKFIKEPIKTNTNMWDIKNVPFKIKVEAKKVLNWQLKLKRKIKYIDNLYKIPYNYIEKKGKFVFTPKFPKKLKISHEKYEIILVPYGCAKIRISIFPKERKSD